jgi:hypothetical protein
MPELIAKELRIFALVLTVFIIASRVELLPGGSRYLDGLPLLLAEPVVTEHAFNNGFLIIVVVLFLIVLTFDSVSVLATPGGGLFGFGEYVGAVFFFVTAGASLLLAVRGVLRLVVSVVILEFLGPLGLKVLQGTVAEFCPIAIVDMTHGSLNGFLLRRILCGGGLV